MCGDAALMSVDFVLLTAPDGKYLSVEPTQVVALRGSAGHGTMHEGVHCVVFTVDGKFLSVVESCAEVEQRLRVHNPHMGPVERLPEPKK